MTKTTFGTPSGIEVPAITAQQMRRVDEVAVEDVGLGLLQMMENAGRGLAWHVRDAGEMGAIIVAGPGGNGGGGLTCARHLANRDQEVEILLNRGPDELTGTAAHQLGILDEMAVPIHTELDRLSESSEPQVVVDALIGYGLAGEVRTHARRYIQAMNQRDAPTISLDIPSGIDATSGETMGKSVTPDLTVTLAVPKTGLADIHGPVSLLDIGIPAVVYDKLDIDYSNPFTESDWVMLQS